MTLISLCRALRPLTLEGPTQARSYASLSGIHNGIRRSERIRPQGARVGDDGKPLTYRERQQARIAAAKPTFRIRRGKKDITEDPNAANPLSRRARFFDPESPFGKKSLVYQLKSGKLKEELRILQEEDSKPRETRGDVFSERIQAFGSGGREPRGESSGGRSRERFSDRPRPARFGGFGEGRTPAPRGFGERFSDRPRPTRFHGLEEPRTPREFGDRRLRQGSEGARDQDERPFHSDRRRDNEGPTSAPRSRSEPPAEDRPRREQRDHHDHPLSIPYTTAASQFLYGKSVVEAALRGSRRQLYKLYVYRGRNVDSQTRAAGIYKNVRTSQDVNIEHLAEAKNIEIIRLGDDGLRLMSKMSGGRPHNNFILEASPLPQLPVNALGRLSESVDKPGFHLDLAHQSAEEIAVAGSSNFISTLAASTHKPFVVLLHGVLDPGNVGAILRSAGFLGATAVATTKRGSAPLTPVALKAAAGASEALTLLTVDSVERFLDESRENGWTVYAAVPPPANGKHPRAFMDMSEVEEADPLREKPCILILGSEGEGLGKQVLRRTDCDVNIPSAPNMELVDSLNVSVAAGLLCNAFLKGKIGEQMKMQKEKEEKFSLF